MTCGVKKPGRTRDGRPDKDIDKTSQARGARRQARWYHLCMN